MAHDTHMSVVFACSGYNGVAELAFKHLARIQNHPDRDKSDTPTGVANMLAYLAEYNGVRTASKGGLFTWGAVGNYWRGEEFVEWLKPFFLELYRGVNFHSDTFDGPLNFEHILVFFEPEQDEQAQAFEISYDENTDELSVKHHRCPFAWMQF